ncbi:hypothetical protein SAMN05216191_11996 [Paenibacillus jilunlii]|uniref:DNA (cytosine-5-)-methyltransferase n=1 Tax=Paenibacillus jilunlii TaxID=682956 RepID=A0A1G9WJR8_9BACL|nr:hypothetical protein SAMN05216191_11996 [Paenibacillus jilunlii]
MSQSMKYLKQKSGVADSPAKTYPLPIKGKEKVSKETEADIFINTPNSSSKEDLIGLLSRMFPDYLTVIKEMISKSSSEQWLNSGMVWRGEYWMQNTLEHPNDVEESTLSQVVEANAPLKYFLNRAQLLSLLDRAWERKKPLPPDLARAICLQLSTLYSMPELEERLLQDPKQKDIEMMEKPIHLTPEAAQTLSVRRMLPSEYERLQGFPVGWTQIDSEL